MRENCWENCIFLSQSCKVRNADNELPKSFHIFKICILIIIQLRYFRVGVFFIWSFFSRKPKTLLYILRPQRPPANWFRVTNSSYMVIIFRHPFVILKISFLYTSIYYKWCRELLCLVLSQVSFKVCILLYYLFICGYSSVTIWGICSFRPSTAYRPSRLNLIFKLASAECAII